MVIADFISFQHRNGTNIIFYFSSLLHINKLTNCLQCNHKVFEITMGIKLVFDCTSFTQNYIILTVWNMHRQKHTNCSVIGWICINGATQ